MKKNVNINVSQQRKRRRKAFFIFSCIYAVLLIYLALQVASYQNTTPNSGNFFAALVPAIKSLVENPVYLVSFSLAGPATLRDLGIVTLIGVLSLALLWYDDVRHMHDLPLGGSGTARWEDDYKGFAKEYTDSDKYSNTLLSKHVSLALNTRKTLRNNNALVIGGSGSGKTRYFVKPNVLQASCNYVITDPSGEILESTGEVLRKNDYDIKVFNLVEMQKSNCYNPFHYIRDDQGVIMMINCLIKNTTPPEAHTGDPFWEKSETALLQALCFYLRDYRPEAEQNFATIMELLRWAEVDERDSNFESVLDRIFLKSKTRGKGGKNISGRSLEEGTEEVIKLRKYMQKTMYRDEKGCIRTNDEAKSIEELDAQGTSIALKQYKIFKMGAGKTAKSILISCAVRLTVFNLPQFARLTNEDNIHLEELGGNNENGKTKQALYVIIPAADSTFNFLVSMMYSQLFETLYYIAETKCQGQRLPRHVRFMLDEFANIGTIPEYTKKLATMRKYEISCSVILQNLAQIKTMYKDDWESIIGNCDSLVFLGGKEYTTLEYISKELGKQTIITKDRSMRVGGGKSSGTDTGSYKETARELMMPDELGGMKNTHCVVMIRGLDPFLDEKYDYLQHDRYGMTGDADRGNRYVNSLNNLGDSDANGSIAVQQVLNEDCKLVKYESIDELIKANPEWYTYPDLFAKFKLVPGSIYEKPAGKTETDDGAKNGSEKKETPPVKPETPPVKQEMPRTADTKKPPTTDSENEGEIPFDALSKAYNNDTEGEGDDAEAPTDNSSGADASGGRKALSHEATVGDGYFDDED